MKVLTLTQPWATLVAIGAKRVEIRSWSTPYRGPLAIHAAKLWPRDCVELCQRDPFRSALVKGLGLEQAAALSHVDRARGHVLAIVQLVDVRTLQPGVGFAHDGERFGRQLSRQELAFGDYSFGRFGFVLEDVRRLEVPVAAKGALGLWEWAPPEELALA